MASPLLTLPTLGLGERSWQEPKGLHNQVGGGGTSPVRPEPSPRVSHAATALTGPSTRVAPLPHVRSTSVATIATSGAWSREVNSPRTSSTRAEQKSVGRSAKLRPARRAVPCTHTSLARIHGTAEAGTGAPWPLRTSAVHASAGIDSRAVPNRAQAAT